MDRNEFIKTALSQPITRIDLLKEDVWFIKPSLCDAYDMVVVFPDEAYRISGKEVAEDIYDFAVEKLVDYTADGETLQIVSWNNTDIRYIRFEKEDDEAWECLRFEVDNTYLLITADNNSLMVGFTYWDLDGYAYESDRHVLFRGYEDV